MKESAPKGIVPPNSKESEMMVLGCMLTSINSLNIAADALNSTDFYHTEHQIIFDVLKTAYKSDKPADIHLVCEELKRQNKLKSVGGASYVTTLAQYAGTSAYIEEYVEVVQNKATLRRMIQVAQDVEKNALQDPPDVSLVLDEAQQKLFNISQTFNPQGGVLIKDLLSGVKSTSQIPYLKELEQKQEVYKIKGPDDSAITGLPTHFLDLDKMINGLGPSNMIILAARPAMGKCLTGDTPVIDPVTGALCPIKELVEKKSGSVATLEYNWKLKTVKPSAYIADGVKPTFKIKTELGRELEATAVHPLLTIHGWKQIRKILPGESIAIPRKLPYFGSKVWPEHKIKALAYFVSSSINMQLSQPFPLHSKISKDFEAAIRAFGDECASESTLHQSSTHKTASANNFLKKFIRTCAKRCIHFSHVLRDRLSALLDAFATRRALKLALAGSWAPSKNADSFVKWEQETSPLTGASSTTPLVEWLKSINLIGKEPHEKRLPESVFELSKENLALLVNRIFSSGGSAHPTKPDQDGSSFIYYSNSSKPLLKQLQHLLLRFGILSKIQDIDWERHSSYVPSYMLQIKGYENLNAFYKEIGVEGNEEISQALQSALFSKAVENEELLPSCIWDLIEKKLVSGKMSSSFDTAMQKIFSDLSAERKPLQRALLHKIADLLDDASLKELAHSDVYWDTVVSIEPTGEKEVFDLTVEGTHNFVAGDVIVHNTALALNIAENVCFKSGVPVGIFSLEMTSEQLLHRLICSQAEIESEKIRTGSLNGSEFQRVVGAVNVMQKANMVIDDQPGLKITDLRARARRMKESYGIQFLVIDYLQLLSGSGVSKSAENRQNEISEISRMLKTLARELNLPILCLSQLSRKVEERQGHRPMMSDLRESGCLTGDAEIRDAHTGKIYTIRELAERKDQTPIYVYGVDGNLKVGPHKMVKAFYSGKKEVYELKTRSGRAIKASANHPFLKLEGWTRLDQLSKGTRIALPRKFSEITPTNSISEEESILFAHLLGDGCILPNQPHYTSADLENIEHVSKTAQFLFGIQPRLVKQKNWHHLYLPSPIRLTHKKYHPLTCWFDKHGLQRVHSYEKKVPKSLFECSPDRITTFLHHLWATDGNISLSRQKNRKDGAAIYYASSSKDLCKQTQGLLLTLGIQSTLTTVPSAKGYRHMYHVNIQGAANQKIFLAKVGSAGLRGKIGSQLLENLHKIKENPNCDIIPKEAWSTVIKKAKDEAGLGWREVCKGLNTSYSGSSLFRAGISRQRMEKIASFLPSKDLNNLAHSDIYWDEIVSIEKLGIEDVYDATVENVHNFVANDIIVHNSIEQDSDIVMFLLRREYYDPYDKPGMAELIVAKNRHGSVGSVNLTFRKELAQFANYSAMLSSGRSDDNEEAFSAFSPG